jgi:hypothetical protein
MGRKFAFGRATILTLWGGALLLSGCIPFVPCYYGYPSVSYVPGVELGQQKGNTRAIRVDVTENNNSVEFAQNSHFEFTEVPISEKGAVSRQTQWAFDKGWIWNCMTVAYKGHTGHTLLLRLYRPGYELIEVDSWKSLDHPVWKEAKALEQQEKAVDDLLSTAGPHPNPFVPPLPGRINLDNLPGGSTSEAHKNVLLYAASEYDRLVQSNLAAEKDAELIRQRMKDKAAKLRILAISDRRMENLRPSSAVANSPK